VRLTVRVRPGSSRPGVWRDADGVLHVAVAERPTDGQATRAAVTALARALRVAPSHCSLVSGAASRVKIVDVPDGPQVRERLAAIPFP